jgi:large subunit ribosomal protein L4
LDGSSFEAPSTRKAVEALDGWDAELPVLVLLSDEEDACARSFRNIERVSVLAATDAGVADVVGAASLVVSSAALERLEQAALESRTRS